MNLRNKHIFILCLLSGALLLLAGCIDTSNIETEKLHYSQGQWKIPFAITDNDAQQPPAK
jgi:hypothetical protein